MSLDHDVARLRELMSDAADDVRGADLRDRAIVASRHLGRQRAALTTVVAAGIVAVVLAVAVRPWHSDGLGPAVPTPSTVTPSPTEPSPSPSADPSEPPEVYAHPTLGSWSQQPGPSFPGTLYFSHLTPVAGSDADTFSITVLANKTLTTASMGNLPTGDCVAASVSISPNGQMMSWVLGSAGGTGGHALVIAPMLGGSVPAATPIEYPMRISCASGGQPRWLPDSSALLVGDNDRGEGTIDAHTGAFTPYTGHTGPYGAWSTDGSIHAYQADNGQVVVETSAGKELRRQSWVGFTCCAGGFTVQRVSDDGRLVAVGMRNTDPGTIFNALKVIDMTTGREVSLPSPASQGQISDIWFTTNNRMMIETQPAGKPARLSLYSAGGTLLNRVTLPADLSDGAILRYRP